MVYIKIYIYCLKIDPAIYLSIKNEFSNCKVKFVFNPFIQFSFNTFFCNFMD